MANPSLQIGSGNWAIKADELLGYRVVGNKYFPVPIDVSRATAATRVDEAGLVDYAEILGGEEVTNGDFTDGVEGVVGGNFESGLIGTVANSGGTVYTWALNTVAPISGTQDGLLSITSVGTNASHPRLKFDGNLSLDKSFVLTFDYKVNSGTCEFSSINRGGGGSFNFPTVTLTGSGTYTFYFQGTGTGLLTINFDGTNLFDTQFDNVSIKELGEGWGLGGGWSVGDGVVTAASAGAAPISQVISGLTAGSTYKVKFEVTAVTQGYVRVYAYVGASGTFSNIFSSPNLQTGKYEVYFEFGGSDKTLRFYGSTGVSPEFAGSITNISVEESTRDNIARIDYTDGSSPHLLSEPQRENLIPYSEPTTNEGAAANITYESFSWNIGFENCVAFGDNSVIRYRYGGSVTNGTEYTLSAYVIMDDNSEPVITNSSVSGDFSLNIGNTVGIGTNNANVSMGNNIWRVSKTAVVTQTTTNNGIIKYTTQSSTGFKVVGLQLEAGSYPTSYIPTSGATVTRNQDEFTRDGIGSLINSEEGVLFLEVAALADDGTSRCISIFQNGSNFIKFLYSATSNRVDFVAFSGGNVSCNITKVISNTTENTKFALKWKQNDFALWINGIKEGTDISGNTPLGMDKMHFTDEGGSNGKFFGKVKQLQVYPTALSDAELTTLTTL